MPFGSPPPLDVALRDLDDLISDFRQAGYKAGSAALKRIVALFDEEPLAGFLRARLPKVDYDQWLEQIATTKGMAGSGQLLWPANRSEKVALQVELVRDMALGENKIFGFSQDYCYAGSHQSIAAHYNVFADRVLETMLRDLGRIAESRDLPPLLAPALAGLHESGDAKLDALLAEAITKFEDSTPQSQHLGLERLWDAFERLKSLHASDKKASIEKLLAQTAPSAAFRDVISAEMRALTDVGNTFHIRHAEAKQIELRTGREVDYLFHRLFALIQILLSAEKDKANE